MCGVSGRDDCAIKIRHLHGSTDISNTHRCAERAILRTGVEFFAVGAQIGRFCARKGRGVEGSRGPGFAALRAPRPSVSGSKAIRDEPGRLFLRFCAQGLMKASFQRPCVQNAKTLHLRAASELLCIARREGDSNPRNPFGVHTISNRASSATRAPLRKSFMIKASENPDAFVGAEGVEPPTLCL